MWTTPAVSSTARVLPFRAIGEGAYWPPGSPAGRLSFWLTVQALLVRRKSTTCSGPVGLATAMVLPLMATHLPNMFELALGEVSFASCAQFVPSRRNT